MRPNSVSLSDTSRRALSSIISTTLYALFIESMVDQADVTVLEGRLSQVSGGVILTNRLSTPTSFPCLPRTWT
jgi:hypothetical protein